MSLLSFLWDEAPWMSEAACLEIGSEIFFPEHAIDEIGRSTADHDTGTTKQAKAICLSCPVMEECQEYGLDEEYGIWGGLTATDRRAMGHGQGRIGLPLTAPTEIIPSTTTAPTATGFSLALD